MAKRILVVEDHSSVRTLLRVLIEAEGYRIMEAADGPQALQVAREIGPDLIVLDLMMPELDGEHVIAQLKEDPSTSSIPIVVVTGKQEAVNRVKDLLGDENVYMKPFEQEELLTRIESIVGPGEKPSVSPYKGEPRHRS